MIKRKIHNIRVPMLFGDPVQVSKHDGKDFGIILLD